MGVTAERVELESYRVWRLKILSLPMWSVLPCIDQGRLLTEEANVLAKKKSGAVDFFRMGLLSRGRRPCQSGQSFCRQVRHGGHPRDSLSLQLGKVVSVVV